MGVTGSDARIEIRSPRGKGESGWRADATVESDSLIVRRTGLTEEILRIQGPSVRDCA